jgi:hypothetical protein
VALVEGEETGFSASKLGGEVDEGRINGEMGQTPTELKQRFFWITIKL